MHGIMNIW